MINLISSKQSEQYGNSIAVVLPNEDRIKNWGRRTL